MPVPFVGYLTPEDRRTGFAVCVAATVVLVAGVLGVLLATHLSPCNPRNMSRCGRRLSSTLQGLDDTHLSPQEETAAVCPTLMEALDCYYWFSQRCLPASEQHFYAKVYVDSSAVVDGLCRSPEPLLVTHGHCLRAARQQRSKCTNLFDERLHVRDGGEDSDGGGRTLGGSLVDSLYDPDGIGTFQTPLCRAIREFILCNLQLVNDLCGLSVALRLQDLHDNLTSLVFTDKCEADLRPVLAEVAVSLPAGDSSTTSTWPFAFVGALLALAVFAILCKRLLRSEK